LKVNSPKTKQKTPAARGAQKCLRVMYPWVLVGYFAPVQDVYLPKNAIVVEALLLLVMSSWGLNINFVELSNEAMPIINVGGNIGVVLYSRLYFYFIFCR
jgi:hypothetical protein